MRNYARYLVAVLFLIIMVVLIVLLFNFVRNIFTGDETPPAENVPRTVNLVEEARSGNPVRYTMYGVIEGEDMRRSIRITVGPGTRLIEVLQGYNEQVVKSEEFSNSTQAYDTFIGALVGAGYARISTGEGQDNESLVCPLGRKYGYEVAPGSSDAFRTWSTTCDPDQGTFGGDSRQVRTLFQRQIPEYQQFISGVQLF